MRIAMVAPLTDVIPPRIYSGTERVVSLVTRELIRRGRNATLFARGDFDSFTTGWLWPRQQMGLRMETTPRHSGRPAEQTRFDVDPEHGLTNTPAWQNWRLVGITTGIALLLGGGLPKRPFWSTGSRGITTPRVDTARGDTFPTVHWPQATTHLPRGAISLLRAHGRRLHVRVLRGDDLPLPAALLEHVLHPGAQHAGLLGVLHARWCG